MDEEFIAKLIRKHKLPLDCDSSLDSIAFQYEQAGIPEEETNKALEYTVEIAKKFSEAIDVVTKIDRATKKFFENDRGGSLQDLHNYMKKVKKPTMKRLETGIGRFYALPPAYVKEINKMVAHHEFPVNVRVRLESIAGQYEIAGTSPDEIIKVLKQAVYVIGRVYMGNAVEITALLDEKTDEFFQAESRGSMESLYWAVRKKSKVKLDQLTKLVDEHYVNNGS